MHCLLVEQIGATMTDYDIVHPYAWTLTNEERFEVMVLAKLKVEGLSARSDWPEIKECFENVASPNKCLEVVRQLREDDRIHYSCKGCGANVTEVMWCNCGEFSLRREDD